MHGLDESFHKIDLFSYSEAHYRLCNKVPHMTRGIIMTVYIFSECKRLDDYILHYEELDYNTDHLHERHMRHKRSLDSAVHLDLHAFER